MGLKKATFLERNKKKKKGGKKSWRRMSSAVGARLQGVVRGWGWARSGKFAHDLNFGKETTSKVPRRREGRTIGGIFSDREESGGCAKVTDPSKLADHTPSFG